MKKIFFTIIMFLVFIAATPSFADQTPRNPIEFAKSKTVAEQGDAVAQYRIGAIYFDGSADAGVSADPVEAIKWFRKSADQNNSRAEFALGVSYHNGKGVMKDDIEAAKWFQRAAEQGSWEAQHNLGQMYHYGYGIPKDDIEAVKWWRKAAEQGYSGAESNLGTALYDGNGVQRDDVEAVGWWKKAADQGDAYAQWGLCDAYVFGHGVPKDAITADMWCQLAAKSNASFGNKFLKWLLELTISSEKVAEAKRRAAEWKPTPESKP